MPHSMTAEHLWVFTARTNPLNYRNPHDNWERFAKHMLDSGVHLVVTECAFGEEPFVCAEPESIQGHPNIDRFHHVGVRSRTRGWIKENLIGIGVRRFPEARYIAWIDADVTFWSEDWAAETVRALQHYRYIQPWSDALDLGPNKEVTAHHKSFMWQWFHKKPVVPGGKNFWKSEGGVYDYAHTGFAHAITREAYDLLGGLLEVACVGSADHHMNLAMVGHAKSSMPAGTHPRYAEHVFRWEDRALRHLNQNIGVLQGTISHHFHGPKRARNYVGRWDMFIQHQFNPDEDLKMNAWGVYEFATNKPKLQHDFDLYLRARNEDHNHI